MYYKDTEVARNCNVFNDHQALSRIIDARRGTGRLRFFLALASWCAMTGGMRDRVGCFPVDSALG